MSANVGPLSLYQSLNYFLDCNLITDTMPLEVVSIIKKFYIAQNHIYDQCGTRIYNDPFPTKIYRQLKLAKDCRLCDYKVGGSAALKLASADNTWENDDVDIMVYTKVDTSAFAKAIGLTTLLKSWTKGVDPTNADREEEFHEKIHQVLTFQHNDFDKKIQLVFFEKFDNPSFTDFLDEILDYPAHVLYEVDVDKDDRKTYNFFLPVKMWTDILQKKIPIQLHCSKSPARIQKYRARGFEFFDAENT